jgi:hypothetical protein
MARTLDARIAREVFGRTVLAVPACAIFVEGEWSIHPDSSPDGWACYAGMEPMMVELCRCAEGPHQYTPEPDDEGDWRERLNREAREEWERDQARWGHSRDCLAVVPEYTTVLGDAWEVVRHFITKGQYLQLNFTDGGWRAAFGTGSEAVATSVCEAICLAALVDSSEDPNLE